MGNVWKFSKKGEKQICGKCRVHLRYDEFLFCDRCWNKHQIEEDQNETNR